MAEDNSSILAPLYNQGGQKNWPLCSKGQYFSSVIPHFPK